jgi:Toxin co-regulated pilus biosynthesis protein Q
MKPLIVMQTPRRASLIAQFITALTLVSIATLSFAAAEPDQSQIGPPAGDGWQALSSSSSTSAQGAPSVRTATGIVEPSMSEIKTSAPVKVASVAAPAVPVALAKTAQTSYGVVPIVVGGATQSTYPQGAAPAGNLTLAITPQDVNLRNALDRWLQQQGWQLAWKIDDDLPLEFNATFTGDFDSLLTQVMRATNHMRTPTRICEHTNNVVRVVARAANCQD